MSTVTRTAPHSHPAICVKTNMLLSHLAWIRQLKPALLNGRTDSRSCVSSRRGWYHPPQEMRTSSPGHTHSHIAQLGLLFPVSRNQAPSCTISVRCHHPAWLGNIAGFLTLLACSSGNLSTGVSGSVLLAACTGWASPADFTEAFLRVKMSSANEHLLSGTPQSTRENKEHVHV